MPREVLLLQPQAALTQQQGLPLGAHMSRSSENTIMKQMQI